MAAQDAEPKAAVENATAAPQTSTAPTAVAEFDDFGLPIKKFIAPAEPPDSDAQDATHDADTTNETQNGHHDSKEEHQETSEPTGSKNGHTSSSDSEDTGPKDVQLTRENIPAVASPIQQQQEPKTETGTGPKEPLTPPARNNPWPPTSPSPIRETRAIEAPSTPKTPNRGTEPSEKYLSPGGFSQTQKRDRSFSSPVSTNGVSEFSHQHVLQRQEVKEEKKEDDDGGWQEMPSYARYDMYDDDDRLIAKEHDAEEDETYGYAGLGGAGKGYTRVIMDEDAESATSMDEHTQYLFKNPNGTSIGEDDEARDAVSQMQATKDLLTEGQRIAYVGVVRLEIVNMVKEAEKLTLNTKSAKKQVIMGAEAVKMWGQKMMIRIYHHMDISDAEQIMIEQLADHGVMAQDLTPALLANSRVQNPMAEEKKPGTPRSSRYPPPYEEEKPAEMPPPYETHSGEELPEVKTPSQMPTTQKIDIDLRWTVLCDLFLILIADSIYDARSRVLLERVGKSLDITWIDICKFEKRVTDALEMQQAAEKENWNEEEHMENRRKMALKKRYIMMGLATVGGGLVIGLSAGLLAPVIGAGLAAGFTTIGVTGTSSFLAGAGGAAIITSSAAASGGVIGGRAAGRRTGAVKTFEYRPLHNNKRVNLIVTVSGWLTGKVDDVRLPYSTVDPIMGDIYSVLWEPEMLRSMGDTINILATEALTQGLQQVLGSTILVSLMAAIQLPVVLTKLSYLIDNPWAVSLDRATSAGLILADSLIERSLGTRPITLVGYSLGARVIFSCLKELAKKGAFGLIQNVYMFGSPIVAKREEFLKARSVVSGRFVNGYNRNDWILGYLFRLTNGGIRRVAGLGALDDCPGIENVDVTDLVAGHMEYRKAMPSLLMRCGWLVTSEEFSEIEDPDPDDHQGRQRELINEIEEARRELEKEGKAGKRTSKFGLFGRRNKGERQEWEIYEDSGKDSPKGGKKVEDKDGNNYGVLFDIDAIRAELAKEAENDGTEEIQVKEIKSTLPPMKLDYSPVSSPQTPARNSGLAPRESWQASKSAEVLPMRPANDSFSPRDLPATTMGTPTTRPSPSPYLYEPSHDEDEIQMTFDTSFHEPPRRHSAFDGESSRPEIKTAKTVPNMTLADPWNDPDDDDFGKEQEISMTFA
ncbi:hypothetical protein N5P37_001608 [Trichoderma harzianum]|uniref:DUF726 domain protein n=1 Tax=Trichoderma harzianum CBS 226.95 TaxID=983964 RepID=A0A2T4AQM4_TRIHA|nr:hypothetical protein M431DRAFT_478447 [Trichoderma harzianum CBS 226.95]KAK0765670.1 hypothetical protein N5P37_001608 [Trichoderma harzianum]PKK44365.1 hypothetical protein CI102_12614 [Trichoderma harzianum]PTB59369.1 hypothetical protein M431DRAFT_478447 [Trichoderma harzianum CBS 226.95]